MVASLFDTFRSQFESRRRESMAIEAWFQLCAQDALTYASPAERMVAAIGEAETIDTRGDPRLLRLFGNRSLRRYAPFSDFWGMEDTIEQIVSFFRHAAMGMEESKQVLYLLGPVGSAKSSLAERLKSLMERYPIHVLEAEDGSLSPVNESPLGLFAGTDLAAQLGAEFGIAPRYLQGIASPWATKRLEEYGGDLTRFRVARLWPSQLEQRAIAKVEPGDENNQDISTLVGKVDIRKLDRFSQDDPDAYSYSGGLCLANQGLLEFVEMFKAPLKVLNPLLTATQEKNFKGTEGFAAMPFQGLILAHSNESEWLSFRNNKTNEAFLDRVFIVKVPYCLRVDEEVQIYRKMLSNSALKDAPCAPRTLDLLAQFTVVSRLIVPENSSLYVKMRVYNGENLKDTDPSAKTVAEYREAAGNQEGMSGISTRWAFKVISSVFDRDANETAADPVSLMLALEERIAREDWTEDVKKTALAHLKGWLIPRYLEFAQKEIQTAYLESYADYGQALFDRYVLFADHWIQDEAFVDPSTGVAFDRAALNLELEKIEKPAGIGNPRDFRHEVVNFVLRARARVGGNSPAWTTYEKLREVIEKRMFAATDDILPVVSFASKGNQSDEEKHRTFVERMRARGYTARQIRRLVEWWMLARKN